MSAMRDTQNDQSGRCWGCGYLLRGVESANCPECGRPFDRADCASKNFGRAMGRMGRRMVGPLGWLSVLMAATACALVWATVRWPVEGGRFSLMDVGYYARFWDWKGRLPTASWIDVCYVLGLMVFWLGAMYWLVRVAMRGIAIVRYRPPKFQRGMFWRRSFLCLAFLAAAVGGMGIGWPYRLGQRWATEWVPALLPKPGLQPKPSSTPPWGGSDEDQQTMREAAIRFGSTWQKTAGLNLMVTQWSYRSLEPLRSAATNERDPAVKAVEIRILGISRDASLGEFLKGFLSDENAQVREAAADAVGIWFEADFPGIEPRDLAFDWNAGFFEMNCDPPITCMLQSQSKVSQAPVKDLREALERVMLTGLTPGERQAAARSLLKWPPAKYRLRYAEWGVFMADSAGNVQFVKEQLDELPSFVHRIGNASGELSSRITGTPWVFKPVIHLTSNLPMVVNLEVCIEGGRPWVVYPSIDDLVMAPRVSTSSWTERRFNDLNKANPFKSLDPAGLPPLNDLSEGFPWIAPHHRKYNWGPSDRFGPATPDLSVVGGIGVLWQSIIVSPKKLDWMKPADVTADPRFAWWKRLRDVDCSWISSRGEDERFLYYDGPTHRSTPVRVPIANGDLVTSGLGRNKPGLYLEVTAAGIEMCKIDESDPLHPIHLTGLAKPAPHAEQDFLHILESRGLTHSEAAGLVDCWKPAFFERPGRRFLTFMTPEDYDEACPMKIRPEPSDKVRVGIIWTELPP